MATPKVALEAHLRLQLELAKKELRRLEMEQLMAKAGMTGTQARTFAGDCEMLAEEAPQRMGSLQSTVDTLWQVVSRLQASLNMPDRAHKGDTDETEKRLFSDATSALEVKLIRMFLTIERCNFEIAECIAAIERIDVKIGG